MVLTLLHRILSLVSGIAAKCDPLAVRLDRTEAKLDAATGQIAVLNQLATAQASELAGIRKLLTDVHESVVLPPADRLDITSGENNEMKILHANETATYTASPKTASGKPAKLDGALTWKAEPGDAGTLTVAEDGMSAVFTAAEVTASEPVTVTISASGDADLGPGTRPLAGLATASVIPLDFEATVIALDEA